MQKITLTKSDLTVGLLTLGAIVQSVRLKGVAHDLTLGSDTLADYQGDMRFHGSILGPVANRVAAADDLQVHQRARAAASGSGLALHGFLYKQLTK